MSSVLHPFIYMTISSCYSFIQYQSHFITFCLVSSPLILLLILFLSSLLIHSLFFSFPCTGNEVEGIRLVPSQVTLDSSGRQIGEETALAQCRGNIPCLSLSLPTAFNITSIYSFFHFACFCIFLQVFAVSHFVIFLYFL